MASQTHRDCREIGKASARRRWRWNIGIGIADPIRVGSSSNTVADTSIVAVGCSVRHTERRSGLDAHDTGPLPATEQRVAEPGLFEKGQIVDVANIQQMAGIETRTRAIAMRVVGVDERAVIAIGGIVDGVAIGVSRH